MFLFQMRAVLGIPLYVLVQIQAVASSTLGVLQDRLASHPYFTCLAAGQTASPQEDLAFFASEHYAFSRHFRDFIVLADKGHKTPVLQENLDEEAGAYSEEAVRMLAEKGVMNSSYYGLAHSVLSKRFRDALGSSPSEGRPRCALRRILQHHACRV